MISPSTGTIEKEARLVPALTPLTFHWKKGLEPPLTILDEKITLVPAQMVSLGEGKTVIETGCSGLTVIETILELAGFPDGQRMLEVSLHSIKSPLVGI